jgi:hypothetical protein
MSTIDAKSPQVLAAVQEKLRTHGFTPVNDDESCQLIDLREENADLRRRLAIAEHKPLLSPDHNAMRVDISGLIYQSIRSLKRSDPSNAEMLGQLESHLQELGQRFYAGDIAAVDEFLQLYCISQNARTALKIEHA